MPEPMKPAETWATVDRKTGEMTYLGRLNVSKQGMVRLLCDGERLTRVRITEIVKEPKDA